MIHRIYKWNIKYVYTVGFLSVVIESLPLGLLLFETSEAFCAGISLIFFFRVTTASKNEISVSVEKEKLFERMSKPKPSGIGVKTRTCSRSIWRCPLKVF